MRKWKGFFFFVVKVDVKKGEGKLKNEKSGKKKEKDVLVTRLYKLLLLYLM